MKKLILFSPALLILMACTKSNFSHTKDLNRNFTWERSVFTTRGPQPDTTYFFADTITPISVMDDKTISFLGSEYTQTTFAYSTQFDKTIIPESDYLHYVDMSYLNTIGSRYINYYYKNDSINYVDYSKGIGGHSQLTYRSKL